MVAETGFIANLVDILPGQPNTPPGADWPVRDAAPVVPGDPDWVVPVEG